MNRILTSQDQLPMQHWWRFNMSNPNNMSMGCSSKMENEDVKKSSLIWIWAMWTLPMIFWVPTPFAMPAHLRSTNLIMLQRSAAACDIIVAWAPESTNLEKINQNMHFHEKKIGNCINLQKVLHKVSRIICNEIVLSSFQSDLLLRLKSMYIVLLPSWLSKTL